MSHKKSRLTEYCYDSELSSRSKTEFDSIWRIAKEGGFMVNSRIILKFIKKRVLFLALS